MWASRIWPMPSARGVSTTAVPSTPRRATGAAPHPRTWSSSWPIRRGVVEVSEGPLVGDSRSSLSSTTMARTGTAKEVTAVVRRITVEDDRLDYDLDMAAVGRQAHPPPARRAPSGVDALGLIDQTRGPPGPGRM